MKKLPSVKTVMVLIACIFILIVSTSEKTRTTETIVTNLESAKTYKFPNLVVKPEKSEIEEPEALEEIEEEPIVYDGMTYEELVKKLNLSLKGKLKNQGATFATLSLNYEVDPYLSVAIVLLETGCNGKCSTLVEKCNNVGGMKGSPGCGGGSYKKFSTLDAGIEAFYKNLSKNYIKKGLTTPEQIGKKYAESSSWPSKVRYYIQMIKNKEA